MRVTILILCLIACTVHLPAGTNAEEYHLFGEPGAETDTVRTHAQSFDFASIPENNNDEPSLSKNIIMRVLQEGKASSFLLGQSKQQRNIEAWFFPGTSDRNALVIAGVHGTELSSIEVAKTLVEELLQEEKRYYNVIVIPCLFPDNAAMAKQHCSDIGSVANIGRYTYSMAADPNRQMPTPGKPYEEFTSDHLGREIEKENRLLLQLISLFKPDRIANIHAIRDVTHAGIYADPRTDNQGHALGFETDSSLAVKMAAMIYDQGGFVPGNNLVKEPTALYYRDPAAVPRGSFQQRNFSGSSLPLNRGSGISLGTWASTAISGAINSELNRNAMRILTIEFPGYKRPVDYADTKQRNYFTQQVQLYASAIQKVFLQAFYIEDNDYTIHTAFNSTQSIVN